MHYNTVLLNTNFFILILVPIVIGILFFTFLTISFFKYEKFNDIKEKRKFLIFIPARNEANVIANLIKSIRSCDYPQELLTIYVLANNCNDDTAIIAKNNGANVFLLNDKAVNNVGMVLNKFFIYIKESYASFSAFDGYVRLDADNLVHENYFIELNKAFLNNKEVIISYRSNQNFDENLVTSFSSVLVSSAMMGFRLFSAWKINAMITGPGILLSANIITRLNGWHLTSLSEDTELSAWLLKEKIKSAFCYDAIFYDEQTPEMRMLFRQRLRWTKGASQVFRKYKLSLIKGMFSREFFSNFFLFLGIFPIGFLAILATIAFLLHAIIMSLITMTPGLIYYWIIFTLSFNLVPGILISSLMFIVERKRLHIKWYKKLLFIICSPISFITYSLADFCRVFIKISWKPIPHGKKST